MDVEPTASITVVFIAFFVAIFATTVVLDSRQGLRQTEESQAYRRKRRRQAENSRAVAHRHGWRWSEYNDDYLATLSGEPFELGFNRTAANVIAGAYRGRPFVSFEYTYSTRCDDDTGIQINHIAVYAMTLPAHVPGVEVRKEGILGGRVAKEFGFGDVETGNALFDRAFRVTGDDDAFTHAVMGPELMDVLMAVRPEWTWRFGADLMLAYQDEESDFNELPARLDTMADILDTVPASVWARHRSVEHSTT